jgi:3-oxoacyl-[acyl-carrier protein] reductase
MVLDMFSLKGKTAIVTGSARGIGKGIAHCLLECGAQVMLADLDGAQAAKTAEELSSLGRTAWTQCDITKRDDVEKVFWECGTQLGNGEPQLMVNNAGIYPFKPFLEMSEADWDKVISVNLKGVFNFSQAAAKRMVESKTPNGRIVSVASVAALMGFAGLSHYCASKGAIVGFTRAAALELGPNITVNAVCPGGIETPGTGMAAVDPKAMQAMIAPLAAKRIGVPADIGGAVAYLCTEEAQYVTGQTLVVDGGMLIV